MFYIFKKKLKIDHNLLSIKENVFICTCYIPPSGSKLLKQNDFCFYEELESSINKYCDKGKTFITGDFNSRTSELFDYTLSDYCGIEGNANQNTDFESVPVRKNKDHVLDANGRKLLNLCKTTNHVIVNGRIHKDAGIGEYTFCSTRGNSVTDYLLVQPRDLINIHDFNIQDLTEFSDHSSLYFSVLKKPEINYNKQNKEYKIKEEIIWNEEKIDEFRILLANDQSSLTNSNNVITDPNSTIEKLSSFLYSNALKVFGVKKQNKEQKRRKQKRNVAWFNQNCRDAKEEFRNCRKKYYKDKNEENRINFVNSRNRYNKVKMYAKYRFRIKEGNRLENIAKNEPRSFWKEISKRTSNDDNEEMPEANSLYNHFKSLLATSDHDYGNTAALTSDFVQDEDLDSPISETELRNAVFQQKNNKACGPDKISAEIIKSAYEVISQYLLHLYNDLFEKGTYPETWTLGYIVPIFKGGDKKNSSNYRGITLNNILGKIYSQILLNRITKWTMKYNKISDFQFGFQKGKSTIDCLFILHAIISKTFSKGEKLYCVFIDYEKCFDSVNRSILWQKLIKENLSTKMVNAIKSIYKCVKSAIKIGDIITEPILSQKGVKQGDPSSSLLFMIFVNDIIENIDSDLNGIFTLNELRIFMLLYADDQVLIANTPQAMKGLLKNLEIYCKKNFLKINIDKTKCMIFEKGRANTIYNFYLYGKKIEIVQEFKYLGITLYKNGRWNKTQKLFAEKGSKSLYNLYSIFRRYEFTTEKKCQLFDSLILPVLHFSSEIWGTHNAQEIESVHTKFCRKILSVKKSTNLGAIYGELGRVPLLVKRECNIIRYWIKILNSDNNTLLKQIYFMLRNDANSNESYGGLNWAFNVKKILDKLGLSNLWINQLSLSINFSQIKQRILDQYQQKWYSEINNSQRLFYYRMYKHQLTCEQYLNSQLDNKFKYSLTRFRTSSHDLEIEKGRYNRIRREDRLCKLCNLNQIETEYHFLLICPFYRDLRLQYIKRYYQTWPNLKKFENLMISKNKQTIINLSKYLFFSMKARSIFLSNQ